MRKLEPPYKYKLFKTLERAEAFQKEVDGEIYNYLAGGADKERSWQTNTTFLIRSWAKSFLLWYAG